MKPHLQGSLDGLCGIYSIINATKLVIGNIKEKKLLDLLKDCIMVLEKKKTVSSFITYGIDTNLMSYVLNTVIKKEYQMLKRSKPFHKSSEVPLPEYWNCIQRFLEKPQRAVILTFYAKEYSHWTVVRSVTSKRLYLFDSVGLLYLNQKNCTTKLTDDKFLYYIPSSPTYFLWKEDRYINEHSNQLINLHEPIRKENQMRKPYYRKIKLDTSYHTVIVIYRKGYAFAVTWAGDPTEEEIIDCIMNDRKKFLPYDESTGRYL